MFTTLMHRHAQVAFVRVVSGKFEKGMKVRVARTGRLVSLSRPQQMFAQSRATVQEGFAGDVIGLTNPGAFAIGDTLFAGEGRRGRCVQCAPGAHVVCRSMQRLHVAAVARGRGCKARWAWPLTHGPHARMHHAAMAMFHDSCATLAARPQAPRFASHPSHHSGAVDCLR